MVVATPLLLRFRKFWCLFSPILRIVDNLPGATSFKSLDKLRKYYAAGFKLGNFEENKFYIHNHVTIILRYRKSNKSPGKKLIVGFEVYPKSINGPAGKCPASISDPDQSQLELTLPTLPLEPDEKRSFAPKYDPDAKLTITYTYSVYWQEDESIEWHSRWDMYLISQDQSSNIHILAIINSLVIAFLLSGMVGVVLLRTLSRDIQSYNAKAGSEEGRKLKKIPTGDDDAATGADDEELMEDTTGWKLVHGDVFRPPIYGGLMAPLVGSGVQLLVTMFSVLLLALLGILNPSYRGGFVSFGLFLFVFAGVFSGFFSGRIYKTFGGENWVKNAILVSHASYLLRL
ncbi:hypothetical protein ABW19_dt0201912 [Dactylella cylindrospora]|nr:hypothetical protein ABW19_dt0201912 [Dactylella cylindrospora]